MSKPVTPTRLNISALRQLAAGRTRFPNQVAKVDAPHIRRCIAGGLLRVVDRTTLELTEAGIAALGLT